ncbi:MAG TPA: zinc-binding dehydrogenase [Thermoanaerobaculia bacterium]|nr:zinc-binding dehydrogenase [Thermoanaerobaculia bacterium]
MRAVLPPVERDRDPRPRLGDLPDPVPGSGEVVVAVEAAGLNHADLMQMQGFYPPPRGESPVPGLECAGRILELGEGVNPAGPWQPGARVMALLGGGGHGERVAIPVGQLLPLPASFSYLQGAALPEAGLTAWTNLVAEGGLQAGETVLITGATGGMGTMFVQLAHALGARVLAAGRSRERLEPLSALGADGLLLLGNDLPERVREQNEGHGVDLVIDLVGGDGISTRLAALRERGRLVLVGLLAGRKVEVDLGDLLSRRLRLLGSVLRARPREEKARLVQGFADFALPRLADGRLRPLVDRVFPFEDVAGAYAALAEGGAAGKIVLAVGGAG